MSLVRRLCFETSFKRARGLTDDARCWGAGSEGATTKEGMSGALEDTKKAAGNVMGTGKE